MPTAVTGVSGRQVKYELTIRTISATLLSLMFPPKLAVKRSGVTLMLSCLSAYSTTDTTCVWAKFDGVPSTIFFADKNSGERMLGLWFCASKTMLASPSFFSTLTSNPFCALGDLEKSATRVIVPPPWSSRLSLALCGPRFVSRKLVIRKGYYPRGPGKRSGQANRAVQTGTQL